MNLCSLLESTSKFACVTFRKQKHEFVLRIIANREKVEAAEQIKYQQIQRKKEALWV